MKVTKTTTKNYDVKFYPNAVDFTWESFRTMREKHNQSTSKFAKCFICGHKFADNEKLVFITVSGKGNLFGCKSCFENHGTE